MDSDLIINSGALTAVYGRWPSFHDAEVLSMVLDRGDEDRPHSIRAVVHVFEITNEVTGAGYLRLRNHRLVTLLFECPDELTLEGFRHQNAIMDLVLEHDDVPSHPNREWRVLFEGSTGWETEFHCQSIIVLSVAPHVPPEPLLSADEARSLSPTARQELRAERLSARKAAAPWMEWGPQGLCGASLFRSRELLASATSFLARRAYRVVELRGEQLVEDTVHGELRSALSLPESFGPNWDAYREAFEGGFGYEPGERICLVVRDADEATPTVLPRVIDGFLCHERDYLAAGGRLAALIQTNDPDTTMPDTGAQPIRWNSAEWLRERREDGLQ